MFNSIRQVKLLQGNLHSTPENVPEVCYLHTEDEREGCKKIKIRSVNAI